MYICIMRGLNSSVALYSFVCLFFCLLPHRPRLDLDILFCRRLLHVVIRGSPNETTGRSHRRVRGIKVAESGVRRRPRQGLNSCTWERSVGEEEHRSMVILRPTLSL